MMHLSAGIKRKRFAVKGIQMCINLTGHSNYIHNSAYVLFLMSVRIELGMTLRVGRIRE